MKQLLTFVFCLCFFLTNVFASAQYETNSFKDFQNTAIQLGNQYGNQHVLLVFDIDNTLLTSWQALGSTCWWGWQLSLIKHHPNSPMAVAHSEKQLEKIQGVIFSLEHLRLTENDIPNILSNLQQQGFKTVVISARKYSSRDVTVHALKRNHLKFANHGLKLKKGDLAEYPLTDSHETTKVSYIRGIMLCDGLNKGIVLKSLLARSKDRIHAIVFIDDSTQNTQDITKAFQNSPINVVTYRYERLNSQAHHLSDKTKIKVTKQWRRLKEVVNSTFPED